MANFEIMNVKSVDILLGGNIGDVSKTIKNAILLIEKHCGTLNSSSSVYQTAAWGNEDQPEFLNQVITIQTSLSPLTLLSALQNIEARLGRERHEHWGARTIDLDILFFEEEIINSQRLTIPHPQIQNRKFTLIPLQEIKDEFIHPVLKKTISKLVEICPDLLPVKKLT